jgi:hypothetical protein
MKRFAQHRVNIEHDYAVVLRYFPGAHLGHYVVPAVQLGVNSAVVGDMQGLDAVNDCVILFQPALTRLRDCGRDHDAGIVLRSRLQLVNELPEEDKDGLEVLVLLQIIACITSSQEKGNVC